MSDSNIDKDNPNRFYANYTFPEIAIVYQPKNIVMLKAKKSCSYDPKPLVGVPLGMFHCPECGRMVIAGCEHTPSSDEDSGEDELLDVKDDEGEVTEEAKPPTR